MKLGRWQWAVLLASLFAVTWIAGGWIKISQGCDFTKHPQTTQACKLFKALYDWQNAYGGIAAVIAAFVGGSYIVRQINSSREQAEQSRQREERAAKAVLPLALSDLAKYALSCITFIDNLLTQGAAAMPGTAIMTPQVIAPRVPDQAIGPLLACARQATAEDCDRIGKALMKLQILDSRLTEWVAHWQGSNPAHGMPKFEALQHMRTAADLHAALSDLFQYARNAHLLRQVAPRDELANALRLAGIHNPNHDIWSRI